MTVHEKINLRSWFPFMIQKANIPYKVCRGKFWEYERKQPFMRLT